jgi:hypothetical protein
MVKDELARHGVVEEGPMTAEADEKNNVAGWGVELLGHPYDLADWEESLKAPFDPWVERHGDAVVLRSSEFGSFSSADEVAERAVPLLENLNGAMQITRSTRPVRFEGIISFDPSGRLHRTIRAAVGGVEARGRAAAMGVALGPDGEVISPPRPRPSEAQEWATLGESHDLLADALIYYSRDEWFDIYKAVECLEDWVADGEGGLRNRNWISSTKLKELKQTANSLRHRRGGKHKPSKDVLTKGEARQLLATLIRCAFAEAKGRMTPSEEREE